MCGEYEEFSMVRGKVDELRTDGRSQSRHFDVRTLTNTKSFPLRNILGHVWNQGSCGFTTTIPYAATWVVFIALRGYEHTAVVEFEVFPLYMDAL